MNKEFQDLIDKHDWQTLVKLLISLDPSDIADVIDECSPEDGSNILNSMTVEKATEVFEYLPLEVQKELINILSSGDLSLLLNQMSSDDRTRLLEELPTVLLKRVMKILNSETSKVTGLLLAYNENFVGRYMNKDYFFAKANMNVNQAIEYLRTYAKTRKDHIVNMVYVVDEQGKFVRNRN